MKPWAERLPDHKAVVDPTGSWTYRELDRILSRTADWLRRSGVRAGDRVMIVGENCREFAGALLAIASLDAWPVPVNAHLSAREIDAVRDHCGARRVIYTTGVSPHATEHANRNGALVEDVCNLGRIGLGPLNENVQPEPIDADIGNRVAALIYTSGTTGLPKGVLLTHNNLIFSAGGAAKIRSLSPEDCLYGVLPLSHIVGLSIVFLGTLLSGATIYLEASLRSHGSASDTREAKNYGHVGRAFDVLAISAIRKSEKTRVAQTLSAAHHFLFWSSATPFDQGVDRESLRSAPSSRLWHNRMFAKYRSSETRCAAALG